MLSILKYEDIDRNAWNVLVQECKTGTWFQSPAAYDFFASQPSLFTPFVFGIENEGKLHGICAGYVTREKNVIKQLFTRRAIIIGGPALADDATLEEVASLMGKVRQELQSQAIYVETRNFNDYSRWRNAFEIAGFHYQPHLNFHIDTCSSEVVEANLGKSRKRDIRTTIREGVTIVEINNNGDRNENYEKISEFYAVLKKLYQTRVKTPLFPLSFFLALSNHPDARFLLTEYKGHVIGGTVCVELSGKCLYEWFACGEDGVYPHIFPSCYATYAGVMYAAEHGCPRFDMMGAGKPDAAYGVRDFKAKFGGLLVEYGRNLLINNHLLYSIGSWYIRWIKSTIRHHTNTTIRVLLGEITSYKAIVIARYIRKYYPEVELWGYDNKPLTRWCHTRYIDKYIQLHNTKNDKTSYVKQLAECAKQNAIDVLIPVHSDYIGTIIEHKDLFGDMLDYLGKYADYQTLHEKNRLMQVANEQGGRVPKSYSSIAEANIPFVVKPTDLSSSKGVRYCFSEKDRENIENEYKNYSHPYICQEYVQGEGCGYEVYCREGKVLREYGHLRLAEYPITGGSSVYRRGFMHADMRPMAEAILHCVPWTGFAMFEFKLTPDNRLVLIEVNPRIWGSIHQTLAGGCRLFDPLLNSEVREEIADMQKVNESPIRTILNPQVYIVMAQYLLRGKWGSAKDYWRHRRFIHRDVSLLDDPKGVFSIIIRKLL
ncbi:MAG: GNAT family N-acetyltransferase [Paludibacteraceae bacterium]|nr:GNAT family N-acetyltransferase [Paludibacteraceae bacterium]